MTYGCRVRRLMSSMLQWVLDSPGRAIGLQAIWSIRKLAIYQSE